MPGQNSKSVCRLKKGRNPWYTPSLKKGKEKGGWDCWNPFSKTHTEICGGSGFIWCILCFLLSTNAKSSWSRVLKYRLYLISFLVVCFPFMLLMAVVRLPLKEWVLKQQPRDNAGRSIWMLPPHLLQYQKQPPWCRQPLQKCKYPQSVCSGHPNRKSGLNKLSHLRSSPEPRGRYAHLDVGSAQVAWGHHGASQNRLSDWAQWLVTYFYGLFLYC